MDCDETVSNDADLVRRSLGGDGQAFDALFYRYYDKVRSHAYRMVLDEHLADDIAQESFIRIAANLHRLREGYAFAPWIFRISGNIAKDKIRARKAYACRLEAYANQTQADTSTISDSDEALGSVRNALRRLPVRQREAISLVWLEGKSHTEAAAIIGCTVATVSWRVFSAKSKLRASLSK